ncbi:MAG TPA: hypothetical protein PK883_02715 [Anaerolineaceae bacterium]|nr:hypothetical protein [Anaerolineaceae bacterium]
MNDRITDRDIELISSYLDSRLSPAENEKVRARLKSEPQFKQLLDEFTYTRRLLQALPQKRAPRNFTLSTEKAPIPRRAVWLQPALSFVSIAAAVMLVVVFSSSYLFGSARSSTAKEAAPEAAMLAAENASTEANPPAIINWNPVMGMGGGGGDMAAQEVYTGGVGGGGAGGPGWDVSVPAAGGGTSDATEEPLPESPVEPGLAPAPVEELPAEATAIPEVAAVTEEPPLTVMSEPRELDPAASNAEGDLSSLILGIPDEEQQGQIMSSDQPPVVDEPNRPDLRSLLLIISGAVALLAGAAALVLRRY